MAQTAKSLVAKAVKLATTTPVSAVRQFPPVEALYNPQSGHNYFSPETWANLQKVPDATLTAFAHRIGLASVIPNAEDIRQACIHKSYPSFYASHCPHDPSLLSNATLSVLGNSLMGLFAAEYVHATYPHLPTRAIKAAVSAYVGTATCAVVAREMGAVHLVRWNRTDSLPSLPAPVSLSEVLSTVPRALTALIYRNRSLPSARKFVHTYFLSRDVDLRPLLKFRDPKMALAKTVDKFQRDRPISRLLKETGRRSNAPVFVVGIYSGEDQLGEGFGSSLKMAEYRAAEDSLHRLYLTRTPPHLVSLSSSTFADGRGTVYDLRGTDASLSYAPVELGETEAVYASKDF